MSTTLNLDDEFRQRKEDFLASLNQDGSSTAQAATRIDELRNLVKAKAPFLPASQLRQYENQLKELDIKLSSLKSKEKKQSKFSFGKTTTSTSTSTLGPPTASSSHIPVTPVEPTASPSGPSTSTLPYTYIRQPLLSGATISLESLDYSIIDFRDTSQLHSSSSSTSISASIHLKRLKGCVIIGGKLEGSVLIDEVENCTIVLCASQFRVHSSRRTVLLLHATSNPIIEHCQSLYFGSYSGFMGPPATPNLCTQVHDFDWVKSSRSPNWTELGETTSEMLFSKEDLNTIDSLQNSNFDDIHAGKGSSSSTETVRAVVERLTGSTSSLASTASDS